MRTTTVIVGAGHAGLAMSRRLTERSIDHVVLERGEAGNSWRTERWPGLRLLTPNWQTRLPGLGEGGGDPDGYMTTTEVADLLSGYAKGIEAPVTAHTRVTSLRARGSVYEVVTDHGVWTAPTVVLASGACNLARLPPVARAVPPSITSVPAASYRGAQHLPDGGVLVVGASATGVQLADEINAAGRPVTLAVGEHVRLPRIYRGRDIFWWMDATGLLDQRYDEIDDLVRARHLPSPQLIGTPEHATIDLNTLSRNGVRLVGRVGRFSDGVVQFSGGLAHLCTLADLKMERLLAGFDQWARATAFGDAVDPPQRFEPIRIDPRPALELDLHSGEIQSIVWATGWRPDYSWLGMPLVGRDGQIRHDGGVVTAAPGVYLLGTPFLRRRRSSFIHGAGPDTSELSEHLHRFLASRAHHPWVSYRPTRQTAAAAAIERNGARAATDPVG